MRKLFNEQMKIGAIDIASIKIDKQSRDQIPKTLLGLQYIYTNTELRDQLFQVLKQALPKSSFQGLGRYGMSAWEILVLASIKLSCDTDYDHLKEISDNHQNVRLILGLSPLIDNDTTYGLQTLKDNIGLLSDDTLKKMNQIVVEHAQKFCGKSDDSALFCRCDSFVVQTDVHYPTDIGLMFDAIRKVLVLVSRLCEQLDITGWRQSKMNIKAVKKCYRIAQKLKYSTSKNQEIREKRTQIVKEAYIAYIDIVRNYLQKTTDTIGLIRTEYQWLEANIQEIEYFIAHAERQIDQTYRRVIENEKIPHNEKVFSIFEMHTEWISKGKAGVPQELGRRLAVVEDQYGFIIDYHIGKNETDDQITIPIMKSAKKAFPDITGCSFDKGFYTPENKRKMKKFLDLVVLPKKGKRNQKEQAEETDVFFRKAKRQHSAVESAIGALQNHGLKKCKDKGVDGFSRHVGIGIMAFNIHKLGAFIQEAYRKNKTRRRKYCITYNENRRYQPA